MAQRPTHIGIPVLPAESVARPLFSASDDVPSPRTGEIPPALSPLDAFAFRGRLLQRKFEEEENNGRRLSRLPAVMVASELAKARPTYFQPQSQADPTPAAEATGPPSRITQVRQDNRPRSQYPHVQGESSHFAPGGGGNGSNNYSGKGNLNRSLHFQNGLTCVSEDEHAPLPVASADYFGVPRSQTPDSLHQSRSSDGLALSACFDQPRAAGLQAPASPRGPWTFAKSAASSSIPTMSADEQDAVANTTFVESLDSMSLRAPASPLHGQLPRSPSLASERSFSSVGLPRPSFNYSRPLSRTGGLPIDLRPSPGNPNRQDSIRSSSTRPSFDAPLRQDSGDSPATPFSQDAPRTPVESVTSEEYFSSDGQNGASYIYSKYSLPRGKALKRESIGVEEFFNQQISWNDARRNAERNAAILANAVTTPQTWKGAQDIQPAPDRKPPRPADVAGAAEGSPARSPDRPTPSSRRPRNDQCPPSPATTRSNASTVKAKLPNAQAASREMSSEDHFEKGIECHENGSLQESTYHFRISAKAGHSRAMLFYALACRHGWGMKSNPAEGVIWLQKAVDSTQLEVAEDEDLVQKGQQPDVMERKSHKAQFALSVYELGVSYMNGWGVQQDRSLALRCFEIAGNWGDADALAEAGFCYAEGVGCKKDLKKAADFYRKAEAKGMSMAGNSWIYKEKYMDDDKAKRGRQDRKASLDQNRNKSRTRAFFARKKSMPT